MIDTGGSICKAADALYDHGATNVIVAATHAVFSDPAVDRLKNSAISEVIVTNTLPISEEQRFDKLTVLSIAPLIARAITEGVHGRFGDQPVRGRLLVRPRAPARPARCPVPSSSAWPPFSPFLPPPPPRVPGPQCQAVPRALLGTLSRRGRGG